MSSVAETTETPNLSPAQFVLWTPPAGRMVVTGADQDEIPLPDLPLPIFQEDLDEEGPTDAQLGQAIYDYLRQFPDCAHGGAYAALLRDAYPHFLADMAAHAVMLDAKEVDAAYVVRKLSYLKILLLLEPDNPGLLRQLCLGYFDLAMTFTELPNCRKHLLGAMRYGQLLLKVAGDDPSILNILARIDYLFADFPSACNRWERLVGLLSDESVIHQLKEQIATVSALEMPETILIDDLEAVGEAMQLYAAGDYERATFLLEQLEIDERFQREFPSPDFFYLLGSCRLKAGDDAGAFAAFSATLDLDPAHEQAQEAIEAFHAEKE